MLGLETSIRLPMTFDPERLQQDLKAIEHVHMQSHYGKYHDGGWSAIESARGWTSPTWSVNLPLRASWKVAATLVSPKGRAATPRVF